MILYLKFTGLTLALVGLLLTLLNLRGKFRDQDRVKLAVLIRDSKGGISRTETGFKKFVQAFPPSNDINTENITHIVKDVIQTHDQHPISITLRYLVNDIRSQPVATYTDVSAWAEKTKYKWWALVIGFLGWATVVTAFVIEYWSNA